MAFGVRHEWGKLREAVIGISPAEDFVVFHEKSQRWLLPAADAFCREHSGRRLVDIDRQAALRLERQADALAELVAREGVTVHRPDRLHGEERTFLAPNGDGIQLFVRDGIIVVGDHVIDGSLRLKCRQRERYGFRTLIGRTVAERGARWSSVPLGSPACVDGPFLEGGDTLLNGNEIYVGISGCASDLAGVDWLQALLGEDYRVLGIPLRSNVLHLEGALALIKPGLLVYCPDRLIDGLPSSLRDWDKIPVSLDEASRLATDALILEAGRAILETGNERVIGELRRRGIDVITIAFDGPFIGPTGWNGGLRAAHQPLLRES